MCRVRERLDTLKDVYLVVIQTRSLWRHLTTHGDLTLCTYLHILSAVHAGDRTVPLSGLTSSVYMFAKSLICWR